jgi:hypothetical protein
MDNHVIRDFDVEEDYDTISTWYLDREEMPPPADMLPTHGIIIENVAAGFLVATDANLAFLDFYITNKNATKLERDLALDIITRRLLEIGEKFGMTNFKADTRIPAIVERAKKFGFKEIGTFTNLFLRTYSGEH